MKHPGQTLQRIALTLGMIAELGAGVAFAGTTTVTRNFGSSGSGTFLAGGSFQSWFAKGALPVGSILRSVSVDATLDSTNAGNWANDLMIMIDPTPLVPGGDSLLAIGNGDIMGPDQNLAWANGFNGAGTPLSDIKTAPADFAADLDLHDAEVFLGNSYGGPPAGGTWSGTIRITYDSPDLAFIRSFGLADYPAVIDGTNITWNLPYGSNLKNLAPVYTLSSGTCNKASGSAFNFTNPQTYIVTDGAVTREYTVTVVLVPPREAIQVSLDTETRTGLLGPAGVIGTGWNQWLGEPPVTSENLMNSAGVATSVNFTCGAGNVGSWGEPGLKMLAGGAFEWDWNAPYKLVIGGLTPGRRYALYLASFHPNELGGRALFSSPNPTTTVGTQIADNGGPEGNGATWEKGVNYVLFENIEPDSNHRITIGIVGDSGTNEKRAYLSGFQLVYDGTLAPVDLAAVPGNAQVALTWSPWSGATGYQVKRSLTGGTGYTTIATVTEPSFTDHTVVNGTTYHYVVSATTVLGESDNSAEVSAVPAIHSGKAMLTFGPGAVILGNDIFWTVPAGTVVTNLSPGFTMSPFATSSPASGTSRDFSVPRTYTVTAEDGTTRIYRVTIDMATSVGSGGVVFATVPMDVSASGTGVEILNTGTLIEANHVGGGGETPVTLSNGLTFGVSTASLINPDGGNQEWLPLEMRSTGWKHGYGENDRGYAIANAAFNQLMNHAWRMVYTDSRSDMRIGGLVFGHTYRLQLISAAPNDGTVSVEGSPEHTWSGANSVLSVTWTARDTTLDMQYSRRQQASPEGQGEELSFQGYALHDITQVIPPARITGFSFPGLGNAAFFDNWIRLSVPSGTPVTALAPTYTLSAGATCVPASGTPRDFTSPQVYIVTAPDGKKRIYTVAVQPAVTLGLSDSPEAEAGGVATVTATLSATHWRDVTVKLGFAGSATLLADYTPSSTSIVIPAGQTSGSITLTALSDTAYEGPGETIVVEIGAVYNGTLASQQQVTAVIAEDDPEPLFPLTAGQRGVVICRQNPDIRYDVYLPTGYSADGPALPILYTFNPVGGGMVSDFQSVCEEMQIIVIGAITFRDYIGWDDFIREIYAVAFDVRQRLVFDPTAEMAGGWSGGGVASYEFSHLRGQHLAGVIPIGGWLGRNAPYQPVDQVPSGLLVARVTGNTDSGAIYYLGPDRIYLLSCGAIVNGFTFVGGHQMPPEAVKTDSITWILNTRFGAGVNDRAEALAQAANWRARIAAGGSQDVLHEVVGVLMNRRRSWFAYQAQAVLDQLLADPSFRTLDTANLAEGDFARNLFYYAARGAALNNDWQRYQSSMKALAGVTGSVGFRTSEIYALMQQFGHPVPTLKITHAAGQLGFFINKDTLGLTYALQSRPNLSNGFWQDVPCTPVESNTAWSTGFPVPTGPKCGFYRVRVTPSASAVP